MSGLFLLFAEISKLKIKILNGPLPRVQWIQAVYIYIDLEVVILFNQQY